VLDANDIAPARAALDAAWRRFDGVDHALVAHGVLPDQAECQASVASCACFLRHQCALGDRVATDMANRFEQQGSGALA
jgi:decaprenylphospho-beta-D-erythro-pentofuranosid-2-ulose 2-reductase